MTPARALRFVRDQGVVLASAKGPVPRLTEAIAGEPIRGSWWSHPRGRQIFSVLGTVTDSEEVLACRLIEGRVTLVHRRLWPALVRLAPRFPPGALARVSEEHTPSGRHESREIPYPDWVPAEVKAQAKTLDEDEAWAALGAWARDALSRPRRSARSPSPSRPGSRASRPRGAR